MTRRDRVRDRIVRDVLAARADPVEYARVTGRIEGGKQARTYDAHVRWHRHISAHKKAIIFAAVGHAKTTQISRWRVLWELGRNPNLRIAIVSATQAMPLKILSSIKEEIESNAWVAHTFPHLRPHPKIENWGRSSITIERSDVSSDPTIQVFGLDGKILGSRLDIVIFDDVCNIANMLTPYSREKVWNWIRGEVLSRAPPGGNRVIYIGHAWHKEDPGHRLRDDLGYAFLQDSAWKDDDRSKPIHELVADGSIDRMTPLIPDLWSKDLLLEKVRELGTFSDLMLRNRLPPDGSDRIPIEWVQKCLRRGIGLGFAERWHPGDAPSYTGVDLGVGHRAKQKKSDLTAMHTLAVLPDGTRRVLDVRSGRWSGKQIIANMIDVHTRFGSIVGIEDNGAQDFLAQWAADVTAIPIRPHTTGMNKHDPSFGVESLGIEFSNGKWMLPCDHNLVAPTELAETITELRSYDPTRHAGDRLMAMWIARETARSSPSTNWSFPEDTLRR